MTRIDTDQNITKSVKTRVIRVIRVLWLFAGRETRSWLVQSVLAVSNAHAPTYSPVNGIKTDGSPDRPRPAGFGLTESPPAA